MVLVVTSDLRGLRWNHYRDCSSLVLVVTSDLRGLWWNHYRITGTYHLVKGRWRLFQNRCADADDIAGGYFFLAMCCVFLYNPTFEQLDFRDSKCPTVSKKRHVNHHQHHNHPRTARASGDTCMLDFRRLPTETAGGSVLGIFDSARCFPYLL